MSNYRLAAMATLRKSMPLLENGFRFVCLRGFHATSSITARPAPRKSPRVAATQPSASKVRVKKTYNSEESLPPISLINSARKSGALVIDSGKALEFLRQYQELSGRPTPGWEQNLCTEFDVTPSTMSLLAGILRRCSGKGQQVLAKNIMLSASALGDKSATFEIISSALRSGILNEYPAVLQRLGLFAKKDNDRQAMTLLGKVLLSQRGEKDALEWFRKATRPPTGSIDFDGAGEALVHEGRILMQWKDKVGAKKVFEKAALELDDPSAYFYLSQLQEPGSRAQEVYLLKAASSGVQDAYHNLGALELARIEKTKKKPASLAEYGMAREWFQVAAADGFGLSMLNLALMCKAVGEVEAGKKWLSRAEENPDVREQARSILSQWR